MMAEYWFKPKRYGYGATPVTWQGWTVTVGIVFAIAAASLYLRLTAKSLWGLAALLAFDAAVVSALVVVSYLKTEGEWRWGDR
jgi:hypothetical protein